MGNDITSRHAMAIASARVFETSDNIFCGRGQMLLKRIIDGMIMTKDGDRPGVIVEMTPVTSEPNPQTEGDWEVSGQIVPPGTAGARLRDDGTRPNRPGSNVALKVFFDGPGARSAPGNIRQFVLGIFNKHEGEVSLNDVARTWCEFMIDRPVRKGEALPNTPDEMIAQGAKFVAERDLVVNPICGLVVDYVCTSRKKSKPNEKGAYISKITWSNRSVPGTGDNAPDLVARRRQEIEAQMADDEEAASAFEKSAPAAPPAPPQAQATWVPPAPWHKPANHPQYAPCADPAKDWWWDGGANVRSTAQLRAGK